MRPRLTSAEKVACPECGAAPGQRCSGTHPAYRSCLRRWKIAPVAVHVNWTWAEKKPRLPKEVGKGRPKHPSGWVWAACSKQQCKHCTCIVCACGCHIGGDPR
jgi:hypothetical protein